MAIFSVNSIGIIVLMFLNKYGLLLKLFQLRIFKNIMPSCKKGCASISHSLKKVGGFSKISNVIKSGLTKSKAAIEETIGKIVKTPYGKSAKKFVGKIKKKVKMPNVLKTINLSSIEQKVVLLGEKVVPRFKDTFKNYDDKIRGTEDHIIKRHKDKTHYDEDDSGIMKDFGETKSSKEFFSNEGQMDYEEEEKQLFEEEEEKQLFEEEDKEEEEEDVDDNEVKVEEDEEGEDDIESKKVKGPSLQMPYNDGMQTNYNDNMNLQFQQQQLYDDYGNPYELQPQINQNFDSNVIYNTYDPNFPTTYSTTQDLNGSY